MVDKFDKKTRSRVMSAVKNKNTKPEVNIRKALFSCGLRYKLNDKSLPGHPDLVFPKYKAVIFIHGCFWHNHACRHGKLPTSNREFWEEKLRGNAARDKANITKLEKVGWRVRVVWTCQLKERTRFSSANDIFEISNWIKEIKNQKHQKKKK